MDQRKCNSNITNKEWIHNSVYNKWNCTNKK